MGGVLFLLVIFCFVQLIKTSPKTGTKLCLTRILTVKQPEKAIHIFKFISDKDASKEHIQQLTRNATKKLQLNVRSNLIRLMSSVQKEH